MASQVPQLLRQGVWAALTGGWYHDPAHSTFTNSCHLYLWLFLLLLPLVLHLAFPPNAATALLYCSLVTVFFAAIKLVSYRLHLMFDEGEVVRQRPSREPTASHKPPRHLRGTKKAGTPGSRPTPPLHGRSSGHSVHSHPSSGLSQESAARGTVEDLKGASLPGDPAARPVSSTSPGLGTGSLPASPAPAWTSGPKEAAQSRRAEQRPARHRSEGGLEDTGALKTMPQLSLSQCDVSLPPGPTPGEQDGLSNSCPQCSTAVARPPEEAAHSPRAVAVALSQDGDGSSSEVMVTLVQACQPGNPLSVREPIRIVVTMSSSPNSVSDVGSSPDLQAREAAGDSTVLSSDTDPEQTRGPAVTLVLPRGGAGVGTCPHGQRRDRTPEQPEAEALGLCSACGSREAGSESTPAGASEPEVGREGPASLDPASCRSAPEKRHARVLSVDSGTDVFLNRSCAETASDRERPIPTSKSDLEAKEGQVPNESNFLEFVCLLESISASQAAAPSPGPGPRPPAGDTPGRKEEPQEREEPRRPDSRPGKPDRQSQEPASASPASTPPTQAAASFQGSRQRRVIYRVTSQQDSSVLQVISGPETSGPEETSTDALRVFIHEQGEIRSCYLKSGKQKEGSVQPPAAGLDCTSHTRGRLASSSSTTTSGSPDPSSGDAAISALQQQLLLMVAQRTPSEPPWHVSQDLEDSSRSSAQGKFNREQFYKFIIFPGKWVKVWYDRLTLLALLDRTEDVRDNVLAVLLSVLVSLLGFLTLSRGFCKDLWVLLFCLVMASCQYSLLKSVQPDPASPVHGHNQVIAYSRPVYFCVLCGLILLIDAGAKARHPSRFVVYGLKLFSPQSLQSARDGLIAFLYCFPALSLLGLFPQIDTFCTYLLEQIDMLLFGGTAVSGTLSAVYSVGRSVLVAALLHAVCFSAVKEPWSLQHIPALFSAFCGLLVALCYHLSRQSSDPSVLLSFIQCSMFPKFLHQNLEESAADPLPQKMKDSVMGVLRSDLLFCSLAAVLSFAVSASTVFLSLRPFLSVVLFALAGVVGLITHHLLPQLRKHHPWLWVSHPILKSSEQRRAQDPTDLARLMWFERLYVWLQCFEKYILYPAITLNGLTLNAFSISNHQRLGAHWDILLMIVAAMKLLRTSFCHPAHQFVTLGFTVIFFHFDYKDASEGFLLDFFLVSIVFSKLGDLLHKLQFVLAYVAPWQMAWGSSFHVFAQLFAVPHSAMLFFQALATAVFSTPLSPFLGSVIFLTSYVRPVKFWEKNYKTRHVDNSNTRLAVQMERDPGSDDNNLNSIFYEHLTRTLQESLCGDLLLGRWGNYSSGDCFILASDDLNAFVHLIEIGNGLVTFQLRGLEFRGTYCQQREVEAIMEGEEDGGCCRCWPGPLPHLLSCHAAFRLRWLTWEVARERYVLEGYRILDNSAATMLQVFDLRRALVRFYVKSIIYYVVTSPKLLSWVKNEALLQALQPFAKWHHIERDLAVFHVNIDEDFVPCLQGITRASFCAAYLEWTQHCVGRRLESSKALGSVDSDEDSPLVTLSFALCILGRRALGAAARNVASSLDAFLSGLHALFRGDVRVAAQDEWVFTDMDLLHTVVAPAVRMALKLHQDQFTCPDEYEDPAILYEAIQAFEKKVVICHEGDPAWRGAVLSNKQELLTLRRVAAEGVDEYKVVMLHRGLLSFKVIKVNREGVRGLWAGQQQELIFLRNRNPERGSIQNNKQVLRNLINSSCDQPLGYPMYVSPLTTSYLGTHGQLQSVWGGPLSLGRVTAWFRARWLRMRKDCSSGQHRGGNVEDGHGGARAPGSQAPCAHSRESSMDQARKGGAPRRPSPRAGAPRTGRTKGRSQSVQPHSALSQRPAALSSSGPIVESRQAFLQTSSSVQELAQPGGRLSLHTSAASLHSQPPPAGTPGHLSVRERAEALIRSSLGSSTSSTLSFLFGKRSFSSALVISGLSAAEGGNTSDTQSSSSVNIVMGPSARAAGRATRHHSEPCEPTEATEQRRQRDRGLAEGLGVMCSRASQEDLGLDDTASQQSASDEQQ
ncbi:pecanex-like protein 2 [Thomomys bottae]